MGLPSVRDTAQCIEGLNRTKKLEKQIHSLLELRHSSFPILRHSTPYSQAFSIRSQFSDLQTRGKLYHQPSWFSSMPT